MTLHTDDPNHPDNLTDEEYWAKTKELQDKVGDKGLHTIPEKTLLEALERAKARKT